MRLPAASSSPSPSTSTTQQTTKMHSSKSSSSSTISSLLLATTLLISATSTSTTLLASAAFPPNNNNNNAQDQHQFKENAGEGGQVNPFTVSPTIIVQTFDPAAQVPTISLAVPYQTHTPISPNVTWLDDDSADMLYQTMDPYSEDWCLLNVCSGPGNLLNEMFSVCNATVLKIMPNKPPTISQVKSLMAQCICGNTDDSGKAPAHVGLKSVWKQCQECYVKGYPGNAWSNFDDVMFDNACQCNDPGPFDAVLNIFNPYFKCKQQMTVRTLSHSQNPPKPYGFGGSGGATALGALSSSITSNDIQPTSTSQSQQQKSTSVPNSSSSTSSNANANTKKSASTSNTGKKNGFNFAEATGVADSGNGNARNGGLFGNRGDFPTPTKAGIEKGDTVNGVADFLVGRFKRWLGA
ncbi:hypothetical protein HDU76_006272 [Blyttiomyces sp. JEL0837]|nr:hypothetical protein HDU76_006272 [Blyttiomyces sp. JEL0837]